MDLKGTQSEQNVKLAFAGESQARNKYTYYADAARKEGHDDIAELFLKMAGNELEHARIWFKLLHGGEGETNSNLIEAAEGENYEWKSMYPGFAATAREEGLDALASLFERVAAIENDHERRFLEAFLAFKAKNAGDSNTYPAARPEALKPAEEKNIDPPAAYRCMFCGAPDKQRLDVCPVCQAIGAYERV